MEFGERMLLKWNSFAAKEFRCVLINCYVLHGDDDIVKIEMTRGMGKRRWNADEHSCRSAVTGHRISSSILRRRWHWDSLKPMEMVNRWKYIHILSRSNRHCLVNSLSAYVLSPSLPACLSFSMYFSLHILVLLLVPLFPRSLSPPAFRNYNNKSLFFTCRK